MRQFRDGTEEGLGTTLSPGRCEFLPWAIALVREMSSPTAGSLQQPI